MNINTKITNKASSVDIKPASIASAPKVGPTTLSSTIRAGAGNLPALNTAAKVSASSTVKFPVIRR
jgi:hypothetical protein